MCVSHKSGWNVGTWKGSTYIACEDLPSTAELRTQQRLPLKHGAFVCAPPMPAFLSGNLRNADHLNLGLFCVLLRCLHVLLLNIGVTQAGGTGVDGCVDEGVLNVLSSCELLSLKHSLTLPIVSADSDIAQRFALVS